MAKRANVLRVPSDAVQGEGSYVAFRKPSWGEVKGAEREAKTAEEAGGEALSAYTETTILRHLIEWNWVYEQDKKLKLPKTARDLEGLSRDEMMFLADAVGNLYSGDANAGSEKN
jgi:hypothetical protein